MVNKTKVIDHIPVTKKWIALTFDIGNGYKTPYPILRVLQKHRVTRSTFFLSAPWVIEHPKLARRIRTLGYEIGSHGYLHENYTEHSNRWIIKEVKKAEKAIHAITTVKCQLIRTPNGDLNKRVAGLLASLGYRTIHWSVDSLDWSNPGVQTIIRNATLGAKPGDIVLLHASDTAKQTAQALPGIIEYYRAKGFKFVTVTDLLNASSTK